MYLRRLDLQNIRGFKELSIDFTDGNGGPRMVTLLIGENATCKSTILRSMALALVGRDEATALLAFKTGRYVGAFGANARITVHLNPGGHCFSNGVNISKHGGGERLVSASREDGSFYPINQGVVCGYGVSRAVLSGTSEKMSDRIQALSSLFDYGRALIDPELTLRRIRDWNPETYDCVTRRVLRGMGLPASAKLELSPEEGVLLSAPRLGRRVPVAGLADGYRMTFAWIMDVYAWAVAGKNVARDGRVKGVLLLDEVEQHLHPSMQADAVPRIRKLFPDLQIVATTHSPLVALGVDPDALISLARGKGRGANAVSMVPGIPNYGEFSSQDMLSHHCLFRTVPFAPRVKRQIDEYETLRGITPAMRTPEQTRRLVEVAQELIEVEVIVDYGGKLMEVLQKIRLLLERQ